MAAKKPVVERNYDFSDGVLEQLADTTITHLERDITPLGPRGITAGTVTALEGLRDDFEDIPTDEENRGLVTEAVEVKEAAREAALLDARRLRTAAQNKFGENTGKYNRFYFMGMDKLAEADLPRAMRRMRRVGLQLQAELASEGIDAAFFTAFTASIALFDDELENVKEAEELRDKQTEDRINAGNALYKEIVRVCNIGKDVFGPVSEALYNDYVIEHFVAHSSFGYDVSTFIVPAGGSIIMPIISGGGTIPSTLDVYLRATNGNIMVCTTNLPASPCSTGYLLEQGVTFKGLFSTLGLDMNLSSIQFTNSTGADVEVIAGGATGTP